jgi:hypothetical protein
MCLHSCVSVKYSSTRCTASEKIHKECNIDGAIKVLILHYLLPWSDQSERTFHVCLKINFYGHVFLGSMKDNQLGLVSQIIELNPTRVLRVSLYRVEGTIFCLFGKLGPSYGGHSSMKYVKYRVYFPTTKLMRQDAGLIINRGWLIKAWVVLLHWKYFFITAFLSRLIKSNFQL